MLGSSPGSLPQEPHLCPYVKPSNCCSQGLAQSVQLTSPLFRLEKQEISDVSGLSYTFKIFKV